LNRKDQAAIPSTYDLLVAELRKTTFLPSIQEDAINALLNLTQSHTMSYALYTKQYNDFLRRSRQNLLADVQCVRFINGLGNFTLKNQAKSHRAQRGYDLTLVELQNFLNDVVTYSPELGNVRFTASPSAQPTKKRNLVDPLLEPLRYGSAMVVDVVADVDVEATMVVTVVNHLQTLAALTLKHSLMP
jgi:hypothetical protein